MKRYNDLYTWIGCLPLDGAPNTVMEHTDGSVSVAVYWDGLSTELKTDGEIASLYQAYYQTLGELAQHQNIVAENHWLRLFSDEVARHYWEYGQQHMTRAQAFGGTIRQALAEHLGQRGMANTVVTILTLPSRLPIWAGIRPRSSQNKSRKNGLTLLNAARDLANNLPGGRVASYSEYEQLIWKSYYRDLDRDQQLPNTNPRFKLSHRVADKPQFNNGMLKLGETYTKVALAIDYPDADLNWFYQIAVWWGVELHVTQILKPLDAGREKQKSASQAERAVESANVIGGEDVAGKLHDHNDFRHFISENNLAVLGNCYVIKMHHTDAEYLDDRYRAFRKMLRPDAVIHDSEESLVRLYWRVSQPGQGYLTRFLRPDHTWQVAHMAPVIRFSSGDQTNLQMLRLTSDAQLVTFSYPKSGTNHALTGAKTGSGKGVLETAQIAELFPLDVNFYIGEVGATYKWVVEAFGGTYFHLDPNKTVVSPFPDYSLAKPDEGNPLDADIVAPTIGALLPLLASARERDIVNHIESVGEQVLQALYKFANPRPGEKAPSLADYYHMAEEAKDSFEGVHKEACQAIINNLNSFLSSTAGSRFTSGDTLDFNSGIVGVDFKPLMGNESLAKFMLVFIALRFKQLAFANSSPCRIILDELHEFQRIDPVLITTLVKQLTRMGRKEAGFFHGISQEPQDIAVEPGVLKQITHRELLYLQHGHQEIAQSMRVNDAVLRRWQSYPDPEAVNRTMNYRQGIKMVGGDAFDLHLTFPQILLDLADSSPEGLTLKEKIGRQTKDPLERLRLFREARSR